MKKDRQIRLQSILFHLHKILRQTKLIRSDKKQIGVYIQQEKGWGLLTVKRHTSMSGQEWQEDEKKGQQSLKARELLQNIVLLAASWPKTPLYSK